MLGTACAGPIPHAPGIDVGPRQDAARALDGAASDDGSSPSDASIDAPLRPDSGGPCMLDGGCASAAHASWIRTWGGTNLEVVDAVAATSDGGVVVVGYFIGTVDFDPGAGLDEHVATDVADVFVSRFDATGAHVWTRTVGGVGNDWAHAVGVASDGSIYVAGRFMSTVDFDPGSGTDMHSASGTSEDVFVLKLAGDGSFVWARTLGGASRDAAAGLAIPSDAGVVVVGEITDGVDLDPGATTDMHTVTGTGAFVVRLGPDGSFAWGRAFASTGSVRAEAVATRPSDGGLLVAGEFSGTADLDPDPAVDAPAPAVGSTDAFLVDLDTAGVARWGRAWGGLVDDNAFGVGTSASGVAIVVGSFVQHADFDPGPGTDLRDVVGAARSDAYATALDAAGAHLWTDTWGGDGQDAALDVAVSASGVAFVTGKLDTPMSPGSLTDWSDVFLRTIDATGGATSYLSWGSSSVDDGTAIALASDGAIYLGGSFSGSVDFGVAMPSSSGDSDVFVFRLVP